MMDEPSSHTGENAQTGEEAGAPRTEAPSYREYVRIILVTLLVAFLLKTFVIEAFRIPSASMENTLRVGDFLIVNKLAYGFRTPRYVPLTNVAMPSLTLPLLGKVHRGDVVVFEFPGAPDELKPVETIDYVKRCVGLPGDTVQILHGTVLVNGTTVNFPPHGKPAYDSGFRTVRRYRLFPPGSFFSEFEYGPLVIPQHGDTISLDNNSVTRWKMFIEREGHRVRVNNLQQVVIDGRPTTTYVIRRNYYFMLGDNRGNSLDSRFWGFVPEDNIIGEALVVYWSWDPELAVTGLYGKINSIRWNRIGTLIR